MGKANAVVKSIAQAKKNAANFFMISNLPFDIYIAIRQCDRESNFLINNPLLHVISIIYYNCKKVNKNLSGTYEVIANDGLNIRDGAGIDFDSLGVLPKGTKVKSYGYYNILENIKWLYVQCAYDNVKYTGFCSENWLKKI